MNFPRGVMLLLAGLISCLGILAVATRATSLTDEELSRNDFTQDWLAARAWAHGADPYAPLRTIVAAELPAQAETFPIVFPSHPNPHTPAELVVVRPFSTMPYRQARVAWLLAMSACIFAAVVICSRALGVAWGPSVVGGLGALAVPVVQKDLVYGQSNGLLLLLLVLTWVLARQGRHRAAGFALGFAAALKLFPALLFIPLLVGRRHKTAFVGIATTTVVSVAGAVLLGLDATQRWVGQAAPENMRLWRSAPMNLSLPGHAFRWLTRSIWRPSAVDLEPLAWVLAIAAMVFCAVMAVRSWQRSRSPDAVLTVLPWMVLATPLAWEFSLTLLLPVAIAMIVPVARGQARPDLLVVIALAFLAIGIPPWLDAPSPGEPVLNVLLGFALPTYALLVLAFRLSADHSSYMRSSTSFS